MEPIQPANTANMIQSIIKVPSSPLFWRESYHINREGALNISWQGLKAYKGPPKQKAARKSGRLSVSKKSFRHAVRIFKLSKKFKNTCRLNAKGAFCPLHTSPAALSQTSSARFFDSLSRPQKRTAQRVEKVFSPRCAYF